MLQWINNTFTDVESRFATVVVGAGLAFVLWAGSFFGLFAVADGVLYDHFSSWRMPSSNASPAVLLIEVDGDWHDAGDAVWRPLVEELRQNGAAQIVFSFLPPAASSRFYQQAAQADDLIFARHIASPDHGLFEAKQLEALPASANALPLIIGVHGMVASEYGVYRRHTRSFSIDQQRQPSFEYLAFAKRSGQTQVAPDTAPFLVNMLKGTSKLPHISAQRVLNGELIPELVAGRSVLIGFNGMKQTLFTPAAASGHFLSDLEFHGLALDSLLQKHTIGTLSLWLELPLLLLLLALSLVVLQWVGLHYASGLTLMLLIFHALAAWLVLHVALLWLPLAELWVAQILTLLIFIRYRAIHEEFHLYRLLRKTKARLQKRFVAPEFSSSSEHWSQVITMVSQTLSLRRAIFLERLTDDHRLRAVKSLHCKLEDINEVRRDYEREPYRSAMAAGSAIEVQQYLVIADEEEVQYLAPLMFAGEVLGFWAFSIQAEKLALLDHREAVFKNFANQIGELLFHRQQTMEKEAQRANPVARYLRLQGGSQLSESMAKTQMSLNQRLIELEHYLDGIQTAGILYDLFGQVRVVNHQMEVLLSKGGLLPYKMTALDLISTLADVSLEQARMLMQSIIFQRKKISLPCKICSKDHTYILHVSPLQSEKNNREQQTEALPFEIEGILCELIDVTLVKRLSDLKETVANRLSYQLRNDMASLMTGLSLLDTPNLPERKRGRVVDIIRKKVTDLLEITEKTNKLLSQDIDAGSSVACYPVDCKQPLQFAIEASRSRSALYGYHYDVRLPELISLVYASPDGLQGVVESILDLLTGDSVQEGTIKIRLREQQGWIIYRLSNQGFGIPDERFQACLHGDEASLVSPEFKKLRQSVVQVEQWGGQLVARSEMGSGMTFELKLRGFI